jgi:SAM-dependent methyltransferase
VSGPAPPGPGGVFDDANARKLSDADAGHWWFAGKACLVSELLRKWAPRHGWIVDVGAGSGGVTSMLECPSNRRLAVEGNLDLASVAAQRGLCAGQADVTRLPVRSGSAAAVCLLDVIEHLPDPVEALAEARRVAAPAGVVIVTVPAHMWLWSEADEVLGHHRRYRRPTLVADLEQAGLRPQWVSHAFSWCVPAVWSARKFNRSHEPQLGIGSAPAAVDRLARLLNSAERRILSAGTLPFGTSVAAVARA